MINYRITKFDQKKRDSEGAYMDLTEWNAISDIGNPDYNMYVKCNRLSDNIIQKIEETGLFVEQDIG